MVSIELTETLRLEVERPRDSGELVNLVANPSGDLGAWGWSTPVAGSVLRSVTASGVRSLKFTAPTPGAAAWVLTEPMKVAASRHVAVGLVASQVTGAFTISLDWLNAAGAVISSTTASSLYTASASRRVYGTYQAPALTTHVQLRLRVYTAGGGTPAAGSTLTFRDVAVSDAASSTTLRLVRTNMLTNPSFETNTTNWFPTSGATLTSSTAQAAVGSRSLLASRSTAGALEVFSALVTVTPGRDYYAQARFRAVSTARGVRLWLRWVTSTGARIGEDVQLGTTTETTSSWLTVGGRATAPTSADKCQLVIKWGVGNVAANEGHYVDAAILEQTTTFGGYFDGATAAAGGVTYAWTSTANGSTSTATSGTGDMGPLAPVLFQNVLGSATDVSVSRQEMEPGQIDVTLRDPNLDPSASPLLRPGRRVRLVASDTDVVLLGKILPDSIGVEYDLLAKNPDKRTIITFTAIDALSSLTASIRPEGVATINELPYVLEGCGVPWSVNGSGDQVPSAAVVAYNSAATALDQVIVTRDTARGFAWVDRNGVVQVWDRAMVPTDVKATLTEVDYTPSLASGFDPNSCVNIVEVVALTVVATTGAVEEVRYGPYRDEDSIAENGDHPGTYTVQGTWSEPAAAAYAAGILSTNADPRRRVREASVLIDDTSRMPIALLDLQDRVQVQNARAGISEISRVTSVRHVLTPGAGGKPSRWMVTLGFAGESVAAAPVVVTPPPPAQTAVKIDVDADVAAVETIATDAAADAATAQGTAASAASAASTAQGTASAAASAASAAQGTANGAATAASTAQGTANTAVTNAAAAQSTANSAVSLANGKNKTTFNSGTPGSTPNTAGDLWLQTASGVVLTQWQGNGGTSWTQRAFSGTALAADAIDGKTVTGAEIFGGTITGTDLIGGTVTGGIVRTGTTGHRVEIDPGGVGGELKFYSGVSGESQPGVVDAAGFSGIPGLDVTSGNSAAATNRATLRLLAGASGATAFLAAEVITLGRTGAATTAVGTLAATMAAGSVGTGTFRDSVDARVAAGITAKAPIASPVFTGTIGGTMGAGSVGTGTFRDSVDDRVDRRATAWVNPAITSPYTALSGNEPAYRMDAAGNVHLRGVVNRVTATTGQTVFVLPAGFRPTAITVYGVVRTSAVGSYASLQVNTAGAVVLTWTGTPTAFGIELVFSAL